LARSCTALSFDGSIADVIAVDVEDDVAALVSNARAGVVTAFRAAPPRRHGELLTAIAYGPDAGQPMVTPVRVADPAESGHEVYATLSGAPASLGNAALLLDSSGNMAGLVLAPAGSSSGTPRYLTAEGLAAILEFWGLSYQTAESVTTYPESEVSNWGKSMSRPVGCWRDS
jgi:hypothetical protein